MRVKLSYTVEGDDVLSEVAKLLGLGSTDVNQVINLHTKIQEELQLASPAVPNLRLVHEMIEEYRQALFNVDIRLGEVGEIIRGYEEYHQAAAMDESPPPPEAPLEARQVSARKLPTPVPDPPAEPDPHLGELVGGD